MCHPLFGSQLAFHSSWASLKPTTSHSRAGRGTLKGVGGGQSLSHSHRGCLLAQEGYSSDPSFSGTPTLVLIPLRTRGCTSRGRTEEDF